MAASATSATEKELLPTEEDFQIVQLKQWLDLELSSYRAPRMTDILAYAKKLGLAKSRARAWIQTNVPAYRQTTAKVFASGKPSRIYSSQTLGVLSADLAFFGKIRPDMKRLSLAYSAGALVARDILNHKTYCVVLKDGKKAKSVVDAFKQLLKEHKEANMGYNIKTILFDAEKAITSKLFMEFVEENHLTLHVYRYSKSASAFSESAIRVLRTYFERWNIHGNQDEWHKSCHKATQHMNSLPIIIRGIQLSFSPNQVTQANLGKFLNELHSKRPEFYYSHFSIDTEMVDFKFAVNDVVSLKLKSISTKAIDKRSEHSVDLAVWIIIQRVAYFSNKMTIIPCYVLRPHDEFYGAEIVAEENALVKVQE